MKIFLLLFFAAFTLHTEAQEVWSLRYQPSQNTDVYSIAGRPGLYLAGTAGNSSSTPSGVYLYDAFRSTDGINWSVARLPFARKMIYTGATFIGAHDYEIWTSADGLTWQVVKTFVSNEFEPIGIAVGNGCFIAASWNGRIFRSTSPAGPWLQQLSPVDQIRSISFGNGSFLGTARSGMSITSTDGITWQLREDALSGWLSLNFGKGLFYNPDSSSLDGGLTWLPHPTHPPGVSSDLQPDVFSSDATSFVFAGYGSGFFTTKDFKTWASRPSGISTQIYKLAFCGDLWVAADGNGKIVTSPVASAPPLAAPPVTISPSVDISWPSITGRFYQVQSSPNNLTWTDTGLPLTGNGGTLRFTAPATLAKSFFRIVAR